MTGRKYILWFGGTVIGLFALAIGFNVWAERYILNHPAFGSVQLMSGFERVLKPAWLDTVKPKIVYLGSSRMRVGFDPALLDGQYRDLKMTNWSFNYGLSSVTAYETRRMIQDAVAQPSVRVIFVSLDAFTAGSEAQPISSGFEDTRLAVTPEGKPTPYRHFWLTMSRYVSGGALGMHAYSVWLLAQLKDGQPASARPDLFTPYKPMDYAYFKRDLERRKWRTMGLTPYQRHELRKALDAVCRRKTLLTLFFPPDNFALIARYIENDLDALVDFKQAVKDEVDAYGQRGCGNNVLLADFMRLNGYSDDRIRPGQPSRIHVDLVHFLPQTGLQLMDEFEGLDAGVGPDVPLFPGANHGEVRASIKHQLLTDLAKWKSGN